MLNGYDLGWAEADAELTVRAVRHLGTADPDAMFVYLGNPDETSHEHGQDPCYDAVATSTNVTDVCGFGMGFPRSRSDSRW